MDAKDFAASIFKSFKDWLTPVFSEVARNLESLEQRLAAVPDAIDRRLAELPAPVNGKDGAPGVDGKDADPEVIRSAIAAAVAELPKPVDGRAGVDGKDGAPGKDADAAMVAEIVKHALDARDVIIVNRVEELSVRVDGIPAGKDGAPGKDADPEAIDAVVERAVAKAHSDLQLTIGARVEAAIEALPKARDGRDGQPGVPGQPGEKGIDGINGKDGLDGFGFDDMSVEHDGERTFTLKFQRGDRVKSFTFTLPVTIDRGVFREGADYVRGDAVTWGGSTWIAQAETKSKPDSGDGTWRLAVKKGRDGKDGERGADGKPGRDKT